MANDVTEETFGPMKGNMMERRPLIANNRSFAWVTDAIAEIVEEKPPLWWWICTGLTGMVTCLVPIMLIYLVSTGVGTWGLNHPVGWAWDITNFVFWIGIGHAGTLISAILFLTRQKWRTSINRSAEAMTIFAVICAGIFPAFHVGRFWMVWFLAPVPQANVIWPNFKSPLLWDVFAVSTYFTVSVIFWYLGLVPDLAAFRDRCWKRGEKFKAFIYGALALGWRNGNRQWTHYEKAYLILAGISTPLVLSVHSVVSFDFATSVIPGWHTTIFPPYFVAGAVFGGFAMVLTLLVPTREIFPKLKDIITIKHLDNMCKITLLTGTIVGYAYLMELFISYYGANQYEFAAFFYNRIADPFIFGPMVAGVPFFEVIGVFCSGLVTYIFSGFNTWAFDYGVEVKAAPYWWAYWAMMICNVIVPQIFWFKKVRQSPWIAWVVMIGPNVGMWFERFVIIVTSIHQDFLPSSYGYFVPTWPDALLFIGTIGLFLFLYLLFIRTLPAVTIFEVKAVMPQADPHAHHDKEGH